MMDDTLKLQLPHIKRLYTKGNQIL